MRVAAAAGLGFLLAVLWFDLMFDVQVLGHHDRELPTEVRDSIAAYYRRVTTAARPMNRLIALAMLATLGSLIGELVRHDARAWVGWTSLALTATGVGLAAVRTVPSAVRVGTRTDDAVHQSALARAIFRDHLACILVIAVALILQVAIPAPRHRGVYGFEPISAQPRASSIDTLSPKNPGASTGRIGLAPPR